MHFTLCCTFLAILVYGYAFEEHETEFELFKVQYGKIYTEKEEVKRSAIFRDNLRSINKHNALFEQGLISWKKGINKFTDMTNDEYLSLPWMQGLHKFTNEKTVQRPYSLKQIPDSLDWRENGAVTVVKNQGNCSASWAFALVGSVESAYFIKFGELVTLSTQQLLDCSSDYGNDGCTSGYLRETMPYIMFNGLQSEDSYPFQAAKGECQYNASQTVTKATSWVNVDNQYQLLQAVANYGPVAASLDASELIGYKEGVFSSLTCSTSSASLAVLVTGYGSENGTDFWIAKTPLGASWGEDGYFRIARKPADLACGLYRQSMYPIIV